MGDIQAPVSRAVDLEPWTDEVEREWDALAVATRASPFSRPGWVAAMRESFFPRARVALQTVREGGTLTAVIPVLRTRTSAVGVTNWHTPRSGLVARDAESARLLADGLLALPVHRVDLRFLDGEQTELLLERVAACRGLALSRRVQVSPYVAVDNWDAFHAGLSSNLRKDARRSSRRLAELGKVTWQAYDGSDRLPELLAEGFAVEGSGWKGQSGTAIVSRPDTLHFYTRVAQWAADQGLLQLTTMRLDDRAVTFDLNLVQDGVVHNLKTGYRPEVAACSPGTLSFLRLVEHACEDPRLRVVEMLGHESPWKRRLATGAHEQFAVEAFPDGRTRRVGHAAARVVDRGRRMRAEQLSDAARERVARVRHRLRHPWVRA